MPLAYSDSDHAGDTHDYISFTGYIFLLAGGAFTWKARKQQSVSRSSAEAEYMALSECASEAVWLHRLLSEFQLDVESPLEVRMDSQSVMKLALRDGLRPRTKHIAVHYHNSRNLIRKGVLSLTWVPGEENVADLCTKALARPHFASLLSLLRFHVPVDKSTSL